jgi:hypothetical protein
VRGYRRRIAHETLFDAPLDCAFELVFADTKKRVPDPEGGRALVPTHAMRRSMQKNECCSITSSLGRQPYPARAELSVHVPLYAAAGRSPEFAIKATAVAERKVGDTVVYKTLCAYSQPFYLQAKVHGKRKAGASA